MLHKIKYLLVATAFINFASCTKDEDCNEKELHRTLLGTWKIENISPLIPGRITGYASFYSDGSFTTSPYYLLLDGEVNGIPLNNKTFEVEGDILFLNVSDDFGSSRLSTEYYLVSKTCNYLDFDILGGTGISTFTR